MTMNNTNNNVWASLWHIAKTNKPALSLTFLLVALENVLFLTYPLFGSFAVNAIMAGNLWQALSYAVVVLVIWLVGSSRRAVDTRTFARIYANLAVPVIVSQREQGLDTSAISARVALSRQFVNFFELHLPVLMTAGFSVMGSVAMLLLIEFWSGIVACVILAVFMMIMPTYTKVNDGIYGKLNNRLEKEVSVIERGRFDELIRHYDLLAKIRIRLSNREALSYLMVGVAMAILFAVSIIQLTTKRAEAGHIYAVITYLWTFAMCLDDMPRLIEEFSNLKDIGKRVSLS